jgi:ferrochelatase
LRLLVTLWDGARRMAKRIGILIAQLGTPDAPTPSAVRRYLRQFLGDRRVVDLNPVLWWLLLNGIILVWRPRRSARLYRKIWTEEGSPLLHFSKAQAEGLQARLGRVGDAEVRVALAMRYGNPSTEAAVADLCAWGADRILFFPMYPQYSAPTWASSCDELFRVLSRRRFMPSLRVVPPFPSDPEYIGALAESVREKIAAMAAPPQKIVISFHGMPQRYAERGDPYPEHCRATTRSLAERMQWNADSYVMTYQSRFGKEPWLRPYTDQMLMKLGAEGVKRVLVLCPGFVADCLETLDEIGNLGREQFRSAGGETLDLVPCLNDRPDWLDAMARLAGRELAGWV